MQSQNDTILISVLIDQYMLSKLNSNTQRNIFSNYIFKNDHDLFIYCIHLIPSTVSSTYS